MARTDRPRIAILGAGPIGIEAALYAAHLQLPFTVYEQGRVGEHLHRWGHVRLFSPFGMNITPLGRARVLIDRPGHDFPSDADCLTGRDHLVVYLEPLASSPLLREQIKLGQRVVRVARRGLLKEDGGSEGGRAREPFRLLVRTREGERDDEADVVLDCTGTYSQHRWLGDGGIPAVGEMSVAQHISYGLDDVQGEARGHFADRTTLVVGAGYSAATTVCQLADLAAKHPATWVVWLARGSKSQPIRRHPNDPLRERDRLAVRANTLATRGDGNVEFHPGAVISKVEGSPDRGFHVTATAGMKAQSWHVDRIVANVGFSPDTDLYRELQVHECYASLGPMGLAAALLKHVGVDCLAVPAQASGALKNPEPHFYILGGKSYGRNSNFLLRTGFEQIREIFKLVTGQPNLDLYAKR